ENPREIIQPGDPVRVKILEIDSERRRLSLSIKRVEGQILPVRPIEPVLGAESEAGAPTDDMPELGLSEDVFSDEIMTGEAEVTTDDMPAPHGAGVPDEPSAVQGEAPAAPDEALPAPDEAPAAPDEAPPVEDEAPAAQDDAALAQAEDPMAADQSSPADA
ncbi:MAG TPA: S1 RNA-binding domain-containing protein, partial [Solirubrobacteraceae bacterium]|nr:S1 RNA-binding domain-containing protein [Solirubrobacteraceae bacterium]